MALAFILAHIGRNVNALVYLPMAIRSGVMGSSRCHTPVARTMAWVMAGAPVLFPAWSFPELMTRPQGLGGGHVVKKYPERVRLLPVRDRFELVDADRPETLALLQARLETRRQA